MISKKALQILTDIKTTKIEFPDIHLKDELFEGAEYLLKLEGGKISKIAGVNIESVGLNALVCGDLELAKKIGPHYFLMANFREVENFLRDDNSKISFEGVFALTKQWESAHGVLLKMFTLAILLKSGARFVSWQGTYMEKVLLAQSLMEQINSGLATYGLGRLDFVALEENNLYLSHFFMGGQNVTRAYVLSLLDGVSDYLTFCFGSKVLKLVAQ